MMSNHLAASGASGAVVVVVIWALSLVHVAVAGEVAAALTVILAPIVHVVRPKLESADHSAPPAPPAPAAVARPATASVAAPAGV
jgi:hypothetical protein